MHFLLMILSTYDGFIGIKIESHSVVSDSATPWTLQSMEFSRPQYWSEEEHHCKLKKACTDICVRVLSHT